MANLNLKQKVRRMMDQFIIECKKNGINIIITQGLRTIQEQNNLYAQGRTKPGKIVTNAKGGQSMHNWGCAFDICFFDGKKVSYNGPWDKIGAMGKKIGLSWGGDWRLFIDRPHFEYTAGYSLKDFQLNKIDNKKFL